MFVVEGATSVYYNRNLYLTLCFVLASLYRVSAHMLSPLSMCSIFTSLNPDFMILWTRW